MLAVYFKGEGIEVWKMLLATFSVPGFICTP